MFSGYKINNGVLFLYVDFRCEMASFNDVKNKRNIIDSVKKYINDRKIKYSGTKIVLLLSGLVVGSVYLNDNYRNNNYEVYPKNKYVSNIVDRVSTNLIKDNTITINNRKSEAIDNVNYDVPKKDISVKKKTESNVDSNVTKKEKIESNIGSNVTEKEKTEIKEAISESIKEENNNENLITVYRENGEVLKLSINDYLIGVVAAEMPASFNVEALKAQSVVARTYTLKLIESNRKITDDVSTQVYKDNNQLKTMWNDNFDSYFNKIKAAVLATSEEVIKYDGKLIDAVYHSTSNGYTEDSSYVWNNEIPYLKSVPSVWDTSASSFLRTSNFSYEDIRNKLGINFDENSVIEIISRNESNRINLIKFGDNTYTGVELRKLLNLRSADFDVLNIENGISIITRGYGHGVGMSQYGANGMAQAGYNYKQILNYYYTNVSVEKFSY